MLSHNHEAQLSALLRDLPHLHEYRYTNDSDRTLRRVLFQSLVASDDYHLALLFPRTPDPSKTWRLREAQGAVEGAEYTEGARGQPCGHIFKSGESTYHCKTCATDETCVLCARCFTESDHDGHAVFVSVSPGNSGCCDCADDEAWVRPVHCTIHSKEGLEKSKAAGKTAQRSALPDELIHSIQMTIGRVVDYICDVFSCSPEQLRLAKTEESVMKDERLSRLNPERYGEHEPIQTPVEWSLVLWNDEKHTVDEVKEQIARACREARSYGSKKAVEVDDVGRSILHYTTNLTDILQMASIIEQIKLSVTVRSARDTFREQMCSTIVDWLSDISGCAVGSDAQILRNTICSELFSRWRPGSGKLNINAGQSGIHDHEYEDRRKEQDSLYRWIRPLRAQGMVLIGADQALNQEEVDIEEADGDELGEEDEDGDDMVDTSASPEGLIEEMTIVEDMSREDMEDVMDIDEMEGDAEDTANEILEATLAGYPAPPPPPRGQSADELSRQPSVADSQSNVVMTPAGSDEGDSGLPSASRPQPSVPKTPRGHRRQKKPRPPSYWLEKPKESLNQNDRPLAENLWERLRIDYLVLYDLRLWKTLRDDLRHLYIKTVVTVPDYKRLLGLRFAGLYPMLSQLYLIADREPDHSIINLSVQLLTTPSITAEIVDKANFLTNLIAILYTFLTTRQVGYPRDVSPTAKLAFDVGAIHNRRMNHFFSDIRHVFQSNFVKEKIRTTPQYLAQFLDLVKLHQGICPNQRAVGEHIEYENDSWFTAGTIIKETNRLCKLVADAFPAFGYGDELQDTAKVAMRKAMRWTMISSLGLEHARFTNSEMKSELEFEAEKCLITDSSTTRDLRFPKIRVIDAPMSFHHPLHYLVSWLLQMAKSMDSSSMRNMLLYFADTDFQAEDFLNASHPDEEVCGPLTCTPEERLLAVFDVPLRTCVWLAQMKAGVWVRNGLTLRHQMNSYRGNIDRDVSYQRDLFMLQAGLTLCNFDGMIHGEPFLAQMILRYDMTGWLKHDYTPPQGFEDTQFVDVVEDFFQLLITLLTEREDLSTDYEDLEVPKRTIQREIVHILCFKPLSFSDIYSRATVKAHQSSDFDEILRSMTSYRAPEGTSDSGTFELKKDYLDQLDPHYAFYNRNQREEALNIYKGHMATKLGVEYKTIVPEPRLLTLKAGMFKNLAGFTLSPLFARLIWSTFKMLSSGSSYMQSPEPRPNVPLTRIETLFQVVLHLVLLAVLEEAQSPRDPSDQPRAKSGGSFLNEMIIDRRSNNVLYDSSTSSIVAILAGFLESDTFTSCHPQVRLIFRRAREIRPDLLQIPEGARTGSGKPDLAEIQEREAKKKQARERQARVMAQFKEQQSSFLTNSGFDWSLDEEEEGDDVMQDDLLASEKTRPYPSEPCMLCQEETNDDRLFGSFAFIANSRIVRETPLDQPEWLDEVLQTPESLDRSAEQIRPFGVAAENKYTVQKTLKDGTVVSQEQQGLSRGYKPQPRNGNIPEGPVATSCGHIMHFSCFQEYLSATEARHSNQISRNHPEITKRKEFVCPLCKALGNVFLPIIWKDKQETYPGVLGSALQSYDEWLMSGANGAEVRLEALSDPNNIAYQDADEATLKSCQDHIRNILKPTLASSVWADVVPSPKSTPTMRTPRTSHRTPDANRDSTWLSILASSTRRLSGASPDDSLSPSQSTIADELVRAYVRLQESLTSNKIAFAKSSETVGRVIERTLDSGNEYALSNTLGQSIASAEIACRGVNGIPTLLSAISSQTLMNLRILSETITTFLALASCKGSNVPQGTDVLASESRYLRALLGVEQLPTLGRAPQAPLFGQDIFTYFAGCSVSLQSTWKAAGHHYLRIAYMAEIVKGVLAYMTTPEEPALAETADTELGERLQDFVGQLYRGIRQNTESRHGIYYKGHLLRFVRPYALTFLRKALVLMHVRCGIDFAVVEPNLDPNASELDRLSILLDLPTFDDTVAHFLSNAPAANILRSLSERWVSAYFAYDSDFSNLSLPHPAIPELVGLPRTFDALSEEARRRRCPTTGKEVTDPAICLLCGEVVCFQTSCCRKGRQGGCSLHMPTCGGNIGLFIVIRKCMVLVRHDGNGSFLPAPYLDRFGEADPALRRHHQLFLNQKRYDRLLRDAWLGHSVPSVISRKLESDVNNGGWETM